MYIKNKFIHIHTYHKCSVRDFLEENNIVKRNNGNYDIFVNFDEFMDDDENNDEESDDENWQY